MTQTPSYQVTDPATGEVGESFPFATDAQVEAAVAAATTAFDAWRRRPITERAAIVKRIAELFAERAPELGEFFAAEEQDDDAEDQEHFRKARHAAHAESPIWFYRMCRSL